MIWIAAGFIAAVIFAVLVLRALRAESRFINQLTEEHFAREALNEKRMRRTREQRQECEARSRLYPDNPRRRYGGWMS